jgi:hypothetical protein
VKLTEGGGPALSVDPKKITPQFPRSLGLAYNLRVPPSDTPVCVAGEVEPVLSGVALTRALQDGSAEIDPLSPETGRGVPTRYTRDSDDLTVSQRICSCG